MRNGKLRTVAVLAGGVALSIGLAGCRFDEHKQDGRENVRLATPFGGMSVKTDENAVQNSVGLDVYPGARLEKKEKDHDNAADVNLNFGGFHLGVKEVSYTTPDSADKVLAFYRNKLTKYGTVIYCQHNRPVGTPTRTQDGLTCDTDKEHHGVNINVSNSDDSKGELKAGSKQHQHIVSVETKDSLTKFGLIALDLPFKITDGDDDDKQ